MNITEPLTNTGHSSLTGFVLFSQQMLLVLLHSTIENAELDGDQRFHYVIREAMQ